MPLALSRSSSATLDESALPPIRETDLDRILKLIPTELLALYTAVLPVAAAVPSPYFVFVLFFAGTACVPLILYLDGRGTHQAASWPQYAVRTAVFVAWASATSWPFAPWVTERGLGWARALLVLLVPLAGAYVLRYRSPTAPPE
jgi:hypothetical protein